MIFFGFFTAEQQRELQEVVHAWPGHLTQVCKTCQGFDWCKLDPRYIVWLILTLKCSEHVFKISVFISQQAANWKDCGAIRDWIETIPNHFLFCYQQANGDVLALKVLIVTYSQSCLLLQWDPGEGPRWPPPPPTYVKVWNGQCVIHLEQR